MCVYLREGVCVCVISVVWPLSTSLRSASCLCQLESSRFTTSWIYDVQTNCLLVSCHMRLCSTKCCPCLPPSPREEDLQKERWTDGLGFKQDTFSAHGGIIVNSVIMEYLNTLWGTALNMSSGVWDASWIILIKTDSQSNYLYADHISVAVHFI